MANTLKSLCDAVLGESGFLIPPAYINSGSPDDVQMAYIANAAADEIREKMPQIIRQTATINFDTAPLDPGGPVLETYALPEAFLGMVPDTAFIDGRRLDPVRLPTSASEWQAWKASNNPQGIEVRVRILNGVLNVINPNLGDVLRFEYFSAYPWLSPLVAGPGGPGASEVQLPQETARIDADECVLDRRLMITAIKWRWKKEKGLPDWEVDYNEYLKMLNTFRARDQGSRTIMFGEPGFVFPDPYTNLWVQ